MELSKMTSPRPTPKFFLEDQQTFSSKKARSGTPKSCPRPRSPAKILPPISRIFQQKASTVHKAQGISFKSPDTSLKSKHYREDNRNSYFEQCFEIHGKLGAGSFGEVYKVRSREDDKFYAVKKAKERFRGEADRLQKLEEVRKHEHLPRHPNCVRFIKAWQENGFLYIQTEFCLYSLANYSEKNHDIPESIIWKYLVDLLMAVKHLHANDLIHLDIKPENIFISQDGICKLGDFGLVLDLKKGDTTEALEGDPKYLAPELMNGHFTKVADVFSLGITILELACDLDLPRGGDTWHRLRTGEIPQEFINRLSRSLKEVIQLMMEPEYRKRSTVNQLLSHPHVSKVLKRRSLELKMKAAGWAAAWFLFWLLALLQKFWGTLRRRARDSGASVFTPSFHTPTHSYKSYDSISWDNSFSDDECVDEEDLSSSFMAVPLSESSTSGDSNNGTFSEVMPLQSLQGGSASLLHKSNTWDSDRFSKGFPKSLVKAKLMGTHYKSSTPLHNSTTRIPKPPEFNTEVPKGIIGPKNLMTVFGKEDSDEET